MKKVKFVFEYQCGDGHYTGDKNKCPTCGKSCNLTPESQKIAAMALNEVDL